MTEIKNETAFMESELMTNTAEIVGAYLSKNNLNADQVPSFIAQVMSSLRTGQTPAAPAPVDETAKLTPQQIKKSITPDGITSFLDGKSYKSLKRHITSRGYTPESYREKFGLPADYPMTAANYSAARAELAKASGLGTSRSAAPAETEAKPAPKKATPKT